MHTLCTLLTLLYAYTSTYAFKSLSVSLFRVTVLLGAVLSGKGARQAKAKEPEAGSERYRVFRISGTLNQKGDKA